MKVMFTCQTCGSPVEYDLVSTETHELRRYGVQHYVCVQRCLMCSDPEPSSDSFTFNELLQRRCSDSSAFTPTIFGANSTLVPEVVKAIGITR
jgi:hypothetical protein